MADPIASSPESISALPFEPPPPPPPPPPFICPLAGLRNDQCVSRQLLTGKKCDCCIPADQTMAADGECKCVNGEKISPKGICCDLYLPKNVYDLCEWIDDKPPYPPECPFGKAVGGVTKIFAGAGSNLSCLNRYLDECEDFDPKTRGFARHGDTCKVIVPVDYLYLDPVTIFVPLNTQVVGAQCTKRNRNNACTQWTCPTDYGNLYKSGNNWYCRRQNSCRAGFQPTSDGRQCVNLGCISGYSLITDPLPRCKSLEKRCIAAGRRIDANSCENSVLCGGPDFCVRLKTLGDFFSGPYQKLMDANCKPVENNVDPDRICGTLYITTFDSPISLLLDGASIDDSFSIVQFPLNSKDENIWYTWKASATTPLVVFDPEHTGRITSADQLFGEHTFGKTWKNGYEALATLDADKDGKVSQKEPDPLGLWYDRNTDGKADVGEVVAIKSAGILELYFDGTRKNELTKDITAAKGYSRLKDGVIVQGPSVDWYGRGYPSKVEAIDAQQFRSRPSKSGTEGGTVSSSAQLSSESENVATSEAPSPLAGVWMWHDLTDEKNRKSEGVLILNTKGRAVFGDSYVEFPIKQGPGDVKSIIRVSTVQGTIGKSAAGTPTMQFSVTGPDGLITESVAELSPDEKTLKGSSKSTLINEVGSQKHTRISYNWLATRRE